MGNILKTSHSPFRDRTCVISLVSATGFMAVALALGIADNPPGILFLFASILALVLAMVNRWRTVRPFLKMTWVSLAGFSVLVVLHNLLHGLAEMVPGWLHPLVDALSAATFLLAVILMPVTFFAGLMGMVLVSFTKRE